VLAEAYAPECLMFCGGCFSWIGMHNGTVIAVRTDDTGIRIIRGMKMLLRQGLTGGKDQQHTDQQIPYTA